MEERGGGENIFNAKRRGRSRWMEGFIKRASERN
jgi:hypothetical protein